MEAETSHLVITNCSIDAGWMKQAASSEETSSTLHSAGERRTAQNSPSPPQTVSPQRRMRERKSRQKAQDQHKDKTRD
jgi:hypothetical protein